MEYYHKDNKNLLAKAYSFLQIREWKEANLIAEEILDNNSDNSEAYFIKMMAELQIPAPEDICNRDEILTGYFYQKALLYANEKQKKSLEDCNYRIQKRQEEVRAETAYQKAVSAMHNSRGVQDYQRTLALFQLCQNYKDTNQLIFQCQTAINEIIYNDAENLSRNPRQWKDAINRFSRIREYKDSKTRIAQLNQAILDAENRKKADKADADFSQAVKESDLEKRLSLYQSAADAYRELGNFHDAVSNYEKCCQQIKETNYQILKKQQTKKNIRTFFVITAVIVIAATASYIFYFQYLIKYNKAIKAVSEDSYVEAETLLTELQDFSDSRERLEVYKEDRYTRGIVASNSGDYSLAVEFLSPMKGYKDTDVQLQELTKVNNYLLGIDAIEADNYPSASFYLSGLNYKDSSVLLENYRNGKIAEAQRLSNDKKYSEALALLAIMDDYDYAVSVYESIQKAEKYDQLPILIKNDDYAAVLGLMTDLTGYEDSDTLFANYRIERITRALSLADEKKYSEAYAVLDPMIDYSESALVKAGIQKAEKYDKALAAIEIDDYTTASAILTQISNYSDSASVLSTYQETRMQNAKNLASEKKYSDAYTILEVMTDVPAAGELYQQIQNADNYDQLIAAIASDDFLTAKNLYSQLSNYQNSSEKYATYKSNRIKTALKFAEKKQYEEAYEILEIMGAESNADIVMADIQHQDQYDQAIAAIEKDDYKTALDILTKLSEYSDSVLQLSNYQTSRVERAQAEALDKNYEKAYEILLPMSGFSLADDALSEIQKMDRYDQAVAAIEKDDYESVINLLTELSTYEDSSSLLSNYLSSRVDRAKMEASDGNFDKAYALLEPMKGIELAENALPEIQIMEKYSQAMTAIEKDDYETAVDILTELATYKDSLIQLSNYRASRVESAKQAADEKDYKRAYELLLPMAGLESADQALSEIQKMDQYDQGIKAIELNDYITAVGKLEVLANYQDSASKLKAFRTNRVSEAKELAAQKDYQGAYDLLTPMSDYVEATNLLIEIQKADNYDQAIEAIQKDDYFKVVELLTNLSGYKDSYYQLQTYRTTRINSANEKAKEKDYKGAYAILTPMSGYTEADRALTDIQKADHYDQLLSAIENDDYELASSLQSELGWYKDVSQRMLSYQTERINTAKELDMNDKRDEAYDILEIMTDSTEAVRLYTNMKNEDQYKIGMAAIEADNYELANRSLSEISAYKDSFYQLNTYRNARITMARTAANEKRYTDAYSILSVMVGYTEADRALSDIQKAEKYDQALDFIEQEYFIIA